MQLYQYTSQDAFHSILSNSELWASKIQYMNDGEELHYGLTIAQEVFNELYSTLGLPPAGTLYDEFNMSFSRSKGVHVFVACFSANRDALSQWRGYCPNQAGCCVGFNAETLRSITKKHGFSLNQCIYTTNTQRELIRTEITSFLTKNRIEIEKYLARESSLTDSELSSIGDKFRECYLHSVARIKHPNFSEESEWRLISNPTHIESGTINFRPGKYSLIPYTRISLKDAPEESLFSEIILGPNPHIDLAKNAAYWFLRSRKLQQIPCITSKIPYRSI